MDFEHFKQSLPDLIQTYYQAKQQESECRLRELKYILEYPHNQDTVELSSIILKLIQAIKPPDDAVQSDALVPEYIDRS